MPSRDPVGEDQSHKRTDAIAALAAFSHAVRTRPRDAQRDDSEQTVRELTQTKEGKAL